MPEKQLKRNPIVLLSQNSSATFQYSVEYTSLILCRFTDFHRWYNNLPPVPRDNLVATVY